MIGMSDVVSSFIWLVVMLHGCWRHITTLSDTLRLSVTHYDLLSATLLPRLHEREDT